MGQAKQLDLIQGSPEWLIWRQKGLGASDIAALFGDSPYKTKRDLWIEKSGLGSPDDEDRSYIYRKGHETEAEIRQMFQEHTKIEINPTCFEREEIFLASLDGYDKSLGILEAKLVGKEALQKAAQGEIPRHHWIQIQAQLHASDSDKAFWGGRAPNIKKGVVVEMGRDEKFIGQIRTEVFSFFEMLRSSKVPELSPQDTLFLSDPELLRLVERLCSLKIQKERLEIEYSEVEKTIKACAIHTKVRCGNLIITEVERAGSIEYAKIPEVKALPEEYIEAFRKKSSIYKAIRFGKAD